jgi:hypothetical protein
MLITDKFVYVHQPKTGGTFVTAVVAALHKLRSDRVETFHIDGEAGWSELPPTGSGTVVRVLLSTRNQHGTRRDVPLQYRDRPILGTIRNPYDRYVSQFEFSWWRVYPEMFGPVENVRQQYPRYPELTFPEFVELTNTVSIPYKAVNSGFTSGFHTQQFVEYFFSDPATAYPQLHDEVAVDRIWKTERTGLYLLNQEHLGEQLYAFLLQIGYAPEEVEFVRDAKWIRPLVGASPDPRWTKQYLPPLGALVERMDGAGSPARNWARYYTPELKASVRYRERVLFRLFPEFDV